tara:strand:+ start:368 stop:1075 length:708 start_codon:yes stop_codon:yes gene_type:complete
MMKYSKLIFSLIFGVIMTQSIFGQDQGHISYEITEATSDNPQIQAQMEMMKGSTTDVYYLGDESLTVNNMMGGMINIMMKLDTEGMKMTFDMMGQKFLIPMTKAEMEKMKAEGDNPMSELNITYDESDTKEIAGFTCYKMEASPVTNPDIVIEAYITEEISTNAALIQGVDMEQFKGFPLEIIANMGPVVMTTTAKAFEATCDATSLMINTDGYTEMTLEEFTASMGQMGGGFGF